MTDARDGRRAAPLAEQVAELDEGLVDGREAPAAAVTARRAELAGDPRHAPVVEALAATRADLAAAPPVPLPAGTADRWSALVDGLHDEPAPAAVVPIRRRPARMVLAAAAAVAVLATVAGVVSVRSDDRVEVSSLTLASSAVAARGVLDVGEFGDPARRAACLRAVAPQTNPDAQLLGGRRVRYDGDPGVLLLLGTGRLGAFTVAVVDDGCERLITLRDVP